jgi:hypothetical protein
MHAIPLSIFVVATVIDVVTKEVKSQKVQFFF